MNNLFKIKYCCISIKMITRFVLITLCLRSSVFYAEAAYCEPCQQLMQFICPSPLSLQPLWFVHESQFLKSMAQIVKHTNKIPTFNNTSGSRPVYFSIRTDLCRDHITYNIVIEDMEMPLNMYTKRYRIISWESSR